MVKTSIVGGGTGTTGGGGGGGGGGSIICSAPGPSLFKFTGIGGGGAKDQAGAAVDGCLRPLRLSLSKVPTPSPMISGDPLSSAAAVVASPLDSVTG